MKQNPKRQVPFLLPALILGLMAAAVRPAAAAPPYVEANLLALGSLYGADSIENAAALGLGGLAGWRGRLGEGYASASAEGELGLSTERILFDTEAAALSFGLPLGVTRLVLEATAAASGQGTFEGADPFVRPGWRAELGGDDEALRPWLAYAGGLLVEPSSDGDSSVHRLEAGLSLRPTIRLGLYASVEAGLEGWTEQYLLTSSGTHSSELRQDRFLAGRLGVEGLPDYFLDVGLSLGGGLRLSNANRYLATEARLDPDSESRWFLSVEGTTSWSPKSAVDLSAKAFFMYEGYLSRRVLDSAGRPQGETVGVFTLGGDLSADLALSGQVYLFGALSGLGHLSNDAAERWFEARLRTGLSFRY